MENIQDKFELQMMKRCSKCACDVKEYALKPLDAKE